MSKLFTFVLFVFIFGLVFSDSLIDNGRRNQMKKIIKSVCRPNLPKPKAKIVAECEQQLPAQITQGFGICVKDVLKVNKITKPLICYRGQRGGEKLTPCLVKRAEAAAKRLGPAIDLEKLRNRLMDDYTKCMAKAV